MTAGSPVAVTAQGFVPSESLVALLRNFGPSKLEAARQRVAELGREDLIDKYRAAFAGRRHAAALILADELIARQSPPACWHHHLSRTDYDLGQQFDLLLHDVRYIRRWHFEQVKKLQYRRSRAIFVGTDAAMLHEVEFSFDGGRRAAWKITRALQLSEAQQLECAYLHSAPVAAKVAATREMRDRVYRAISDDVGLVRRTKSYTDEDAKTTVARRHRLWLCSRLTTGGPAAIASLYERTTGLSVDRKIVSRQLEIVDATLKRARSKRDAKPSL